MDRKKKKKDKEMGSTTHTWAKGVPVLGSVNENASNLLNILVDLMYLIVDWIISLLVIALKLSLSYKVILDT